MKAPTQLLTGAACTIQKDGILITYDTPRRTISTGLCGGGLRYCRNLYNHRLLTFYPHERDFPGGSVPQYLSLVLLQHGLSPTDTTAMITSARMDWHAYSCHRYEDLIVETITTAGVEATAERAGDPPFYYEQDGNYYPVGTINNIISLNVNLADYTLVKSLITATEAKTAVLQDYGIASCTTGLPATGTATDGLIITADPQGPLRTDAGAHAKLGELIALGIRDNISYAFDHCDYPWNAFPQLRTPDPIPQDLLNRRRQAEDDPRPGPTYDQNENENTP